MTDTKLVLTEHNKQQHTKLRVYVAEQERVGYIFDIAYCDSESHILMLLHSLLYHRKKSPKIKHLALVY